MKHTKSSRYIKAALIVLAATTLTSLASPPPGFLNCVKNCNNFFSDKNTSLKYFYCEKTKEVLTTRMSNNASTGKKVIPSIAIAIDNKYAYKLNEAIDKNCNTIFEHYLTDVSQTCNTACASPIKVKPT